MNFYKDNSSDYYLEGKPWSYERGKLESEPCKLLNCKEANMFNLDAFFYKKIKILNQD